jgi:hypothetical protein
VFLRPRKRERKGAQGVGGGWAGQDGTGGIGVRDRKDGSGGKETEEGNRVLPCTYDMLVIKSC